MARLDEYKKTILDLHAAGDSIRTIAKKIGQPVSTVHKALQEWSAENVQAKTDSGIDPAMLLGRISAAETLVKQLHERLESVEARGPRTGTMEPQAGRHVIDAAMQTFHEVSAELSQAEREEELEADEAEEADYRASSRKDRWIGRLLGVILGIAIPTYLWGPWSKREIKAAGPDAPGIQLTIFHSSDGWVAVKWPNGRPSPITRKGNGYLVKFQGSVQKFVVENPQGYEGQRVPGTIVMKRPDDFSSPELNKFCKENESLHCAGIVYWLRGATDPETWRDPEIKVGGILER